MASAGPAQVVRKNVTVLVFDSGLVFRGSNGRGSVPEAKRRQAADVLARFKRNPREGDGQVLRDILVVKQIIAMGVEVIEAEAKFVDQIIAKTMDLAGC